MTEADLQALEGGAHARATEPETPNVSAQMLLRVLAEVRRLRGIILSSARQVEGGKGFENLSRYFDVLMAEAEAIRGDLGGKG